MAIKEPNGSLKSSCLVTNTVLSMKDFFTQKDVCAKIRNINPHIEVGLSVSEWIKDFCEKGALFQKGETYKVAEGRTY